MISENALKVYNALKALPRSAEEIADFLAENRITGRRFSGQTCPIARWVTSTTNLKVMITGSFFHVIGETDYHTFLVPPAVTDFIRTFDRGGFAELESIV